MSRKGAIVAVVALLFTAGLAHAQNFIDSGFFKSGFVQDDFFIGDAAGADVPVPDVVGQASFAAADAILEGDGLDGLDTAVCSSAAAGEVVSQAPSAGVDVPAATVVVVFTSNGTPCKGRPPLWLWLETDR